MKNSRFIAGFLAFAVVFGLVGGILPHHASAEDVSVEIDVSEEELLVMLLEMIQVLQQQILLLLEQQGGGGGAEPWPEPEPIDDDLQTKAKYTIIKADDQLQYAWNLLDEYNDKITPLFLHGMLQEAQALLNIARTEYEEGEYDDALSAAEESLEKIYYVIDYIKDRTDDCKYDEDCAAEQREAKEYINKADDIIDEAWEMLDDAEDDGDISDDEYEELEEMLESALNQLDAAIANYEEEDYGTAIRWAKKAIALAEEVIDYLEDIDDCRRDEDCWNDDLVLQIEFEDQDVDEIVDENGDTTGFWFEIVFSVEADNDDAFIPVSAVPAGEQTSNVGVLYSLEDANTNATIPNVSDNMSNIDFDSSADITVHGGKSYYVLEEGDTEEFSLEGRVDGNSGDLSGFIRLQLRDLGYTDNFVGFGYKTFLPADDFETDTVHIDGGGGNATSTFRVGTKPVDGYILWNGR